MKMKKLISVMAVAAIAATCFAGCGKKDDADETTAAADNAGVSETTEAANADKKTETLKIGGSGPLTGDYATYGVSVKQGAQIAVDEINAAGGINGVNFELLMEDDQADSQPAVSAYAKLMDDGMNVSMGAVTSGSCIAMSEEAKKDGILMITPSASQAECVQYDNAFRICFKDPDQGVYSADFIKNNNVAEKVAVIYDKSNDYSVGIYDNFVAQAKEIGLEVVTEQAFTDQSNTDFSVQLQEVKDSGADLLFLPIYAKEAASILVQSQKMGLEIKFFGCDGLDGVIQKIGEENVAATEGVMLLTPFAADSKEANVAAFTSAYQAKYNAVPDQFAADGYDAVYTIAAAFKQTGLDTVKDKDFNSKMISAMTEITVNGVTGTMTWTADGQPVKSATAVKIVNGAYVAF